MSATKRAPDSISTFLSQKTHTHTHTHTHTSLFPGSFCPTAIKYGSHVTGLICGGTNIFKPKTRKYPLLFKELTWLRKNEISDDRLSKYLFYSCKKKKKCLDILFIHELYFTVLHFFLWIIDITSNIKAAQIPNLCKSRENLTKEYKKRRYSFLYDQSCLLLLCLSQVSGFV